MANAKSHRRILFAALFFRKKINFCWQQYKIQMKHDKTAFLI